MSVPHSLPWNLKLPPPRIQHYFPCSLVSLHAHYNRTSGFGELSIQKAPQRGAPEDVLQTLQGQEGK